jgi:hypothetical protein
MDKGLEQHWVDWDRRRKVAIVDILVVGRESKFIAMATVGRVIMLHHIATTAKAATTIGLDRKLWRHGILVGGN